MSFPPAPPAELTRIERLVGEIIGIRLLITEILALDSEHSNAVKSGALARLDDWRIGSDTPEGADRIRTYVGQMLSAFPVPVPAIEGAPIAKAATKPG